MSLRAPADTDVRYYRVYRGSGTTPVYTVTAKSQWWNTALMTWTDTGRPAAVILCLLFCPCL